MKNTIYFIALICLAGINVHGQTFASSGQAANELAYSLSAFAGHRSMVRPGALTIIGGSAMGIGCFVARYGLLINAFDYNSQANAVDEDEKNKGHRLEMAGGVLFAGGLGMLIAGSIRDHSMNKGRWSGVAKGNEAGIAYGL